MSKQESGKFAIKALLAVFNAGWVSLLAWLVVSHWHFGWSGYGKLTFYVSLGIFSISFISNSIATLVELLWPTTINF
jgi:hypothetical protein